MFMKAIKQVQIYAALSLLLFSVSSHAWIPNGEEVTIDEIMEWEGIGVVLFKTSNNIWCYILPEWKNSYSLILSLHISGKTAFIHCHDAEEVLNAVPGVHKLHRIISKR